MNFCLQALLPDVIDVGVYSSQHRPRINELVVLHLDVNVSVNPDKPLHYAGVVRFRVIDVVHMAFNRCQMESWMHPYNEKEAEIVVIVEPEDEHAKMYLKRLAVAREVEQRAS